MPTFVKDSEAALASYRELGYHIEENMWTDEQCEELIAAANEFPSAKEGNFAPLMQPHRENPIFFTALCNPKIVNIMDQLVSGEVSGIQSEFFFGKPGTQGFTMHQDNGVVEAKPEVFASAWSAMQDVTTEMGGLVGFPRTHREPVLPTVKTGRLQDSLQDINAMREELVLPDGYEGFDLFVPKGATLFMHSHFVHSSHDNQSDRCRCALLLTYIRSGEAFRPGFTAKRVEVSVH